MRFYEQNTMEKITGLLAHEVKNPVSLIKSNVEFLELDKDLSPYKKNITVIKKEVNKINEIISDFMSLFRPIDYTTTKVLCIFELLKELNQDFYISTRKQNIRFKLNCFCTLQDTKVLADYSKIFILFLNIYKNAIESIKDSGYIRTYIYKNKQYILIDIIDNGKGIKVGFKNSVGVPFFTSKSNGSGLGLSICKSIVNDAGGFLKIFNNPNQGCTVRISLPNYIQKLDF